MYLFLSKALVCGSRPLLLLFPKDTSNRLPCTVRAIQRTEKLFKKCAKVPKLMRDQHTLNSYILTWGFSLSPLRAGESVTHLALSYYRALRWPCIKDDRRIYPYTHQVLARQFSADRLLLIKVVLTIAISAHN